MVFLEKGQSVGWARTEPAEGPEMPPGAIPLVHLESILGMAACEARHEPVATHLRDDGSGGDRREPFITLHNRLNREPSVLLCTMTIAEE